MDRFFPVQKAVETVTVQDLIAAPPMDNSIRLPRRVPMTIGLKLNEPE